MARFLDILFESAYCQRMASCASSRFAFFITRYGKMVSMDKPRHPQVIRTWKVERIRKPSPPKKALPVKPSKKSKP